MDEANNQLQLSDEKAKSTQNPSSKFLASLISLLRHIISILFWGYLIVQVFIFNLDGYLVSNSSSLLGWFVSYKFIIFLALVTLFWVFTKSISVLGWVLYIAFYPFIITFWKVPKAVYKLGNWNIAIAILNSFLAFFRSIKYNFISFAVFSISCILIFSVDSKPVILVACMMLIVLLIVTFVQRFILVFKPSIIYRLHSKLVGKFLNFGKKTWAIDKNLKSIEVTEMSDAQLQTWTSNLGVTVIVNKACYFLSARLRDYQRSRINVIFNIFSVVLLLLFTVLCFAMINFGIYKAYPNSFTFNSITPGFFTFFYYSFNAFCFNSISEVVTTDNITRGIFLIEQFFALLLGGIFFTLFLSLKNDRESADMDEVVKKIKEHGDTMKDFVASEYNLSIEDAITELERLKSGLIKVIFYLSKGIPTN